MITDIQILGFTGTRDGLSDGQRDVLKTLILGFTHLTEAHHGDCVGADEEFAILFKELRPLTLLHSHPCDMPHTRAHTQADVMHDAKRPLDRNKDIVNASNLLLACPKTSEEQLRSGTWATIRYARKHKKDLLIIWPDGSWLMQ